MITGLERPIVIVPRPANAQPRPLVEDARRAPANHPYAKALEEVLELADKLKSGLDRMKGADSDITAIATKVQRFQHLIETQIGQCEQLDSPSRVWIKSSISRITAAFGVINLNKKFLYFGQDTYLELERKINGLPADDLTK